MRSLIKTVKEINSEKSAKRYISDLISRLLILKKSEVNLRCAVQNKYENHAKISIRSYLES
jgi:hypothetical protein